MERLSRFLLRHRLPVGLCWLAVLVVGVATAGSVSGRLTTDFSLPGADSHKANQAILRTYGNGGDARPLVPVVTLPLGTTVDSPGVRQALGRTFDAVAGDPRLRVVSFASTGDRGFVSADGRTTWRRLDSPRLEALIGAGVFYGAAASEARAMQGRHVCVVGSANSAGQAAAYLAKHADSVTLLVRGDSLASMSQYLANQLLRTPNVTVRLGVEVVDGEGDGRLKAVTSSSGCPRPRSSPKSAPSRAPSGYRDRSREIGPATS